MTDSIQDAIKCFQDEAQAILDLIPQLTSDFDKAIDLIYNCTGKFIVTGVGKSGPRLPQLWRAPALLRSSSTRWMLTTGILA